MVKSATSPFAKTLTAMLRSAQILVQIFLSYILQNQFKMITKEPLIETIKQLPLEFSVDEVFDKIFLLENIEKGLQLHFLLIYFCNFLKCSLNSLVI